jgi:hypothetical protein
MVELPRWEHLSIGSGGWIRYDSVNDDVALHVRFELDGERLEPAELHVAPLGNTPPTWRSVLRPSMLRRPTDWVNETGTRARVVQRLDLVDGPDLRSVFKGFRRGAGPPPAPDATVELPASKKAGYPPEFFRQVADLESKLRAHGERRPSRVIAEANGVAESSVRWWLAEARKRGMR